jgi:hypothetical protein
VNRFVTVDSARREVVRTPTAQRALLTRLVPLVRPAFAVLIFAAIVYAIVSKWNGVRDALGTLAWESVVLSFVAALAGTLTSLMAWRSLLADEGHRLPPLTAGRIFFVGQLGKYLPGSVWSVVLQMELGKRAGVPRGRAFTSSLAWVGLSLSTALCVGMLGFPVLEQAHKGEALGIAVVSRALFIGADVISAGGAALSGLRNLRRDKAVPAGRPEPA